MDKKVVVLRRINGLWQDMETGYELIRDRLKNPGPVPAPRFFRLKEQPVRTVGSLHRVA